ncbi:MAG: tetratricopeptide repeat protein [Candidatus Aminicenantes bacterium]|nr:tetratricopeptide repeat protein [Candidatus Aminicenantes bacterium]
MKDDKSKKDEYQKTLAAYAEAMKEFRKGKPERAAEAFRSFLEKFPSEKEFVDRAKTYLEIASSRLQGSKEAGPPKTVEEFRLAAVVMLNEGRNEEALALCQKGLKLSPDDAKLHFLSAQALCRSGQLDNALEALHKALQIDKSLRILAQNEAAFEAVRDDKKFNLLTRPG